MGENQSFTNLPAPPNKESKTQNEAIAFLKASLDCTIFLKKERYPTKSQQYFGAVIYIVW